MLSPRKLSAQRWTLPLTAALALVCAAACRDLKPDEGYCATCAVDGAIAVPATSEQSEPALGVNAGMAAASQTNQTGTAAAGTSVAPAIAGSSATGRAGSGISAAVGGSSAAGRSGVTGTSQAGKSAAGSGASPGTAGAGGAGRSGSNDTMSGGRNAGGDTGPMMTLPCGRECSGERSVCDESTHSCVQCTRQDVQACTGERSVCDPGSSNCVECTPEDAHACTGENTACDPITHRCIGCLRDDTCPGSKPVCDTQQRRCVTCLRARPDSCQGTLPVCDEAAQKCVECSTGQTQACRDNRRMCDETSHACVECLDTNDCPTHEHPACAQHQCVGCRGQSDCRGRFQDAPVCDMNSQTCVRCVIDSDCGTSNNQRCDTARHLCEAIPQPMPGMKQTCDPCDADNQCAGVESGRAVCAQLGNFGKYCFTLAQGSCQPPLSAQTVNGKQYCMPTSGVSCEAVKKVGDACSQQAPCGGGGVCESVSNHCTLRCEDEKQCPPSHNKCREIPMFMSGTKFCVN